MIGKTLSHFRIVRKLGEGGMGVVYEAEDVELQRRVALKVLRREFLGKEERRHRFVREAQTAAKITHPHIATVYEIGEADDETFIAMEYVEGQNLRELIRGTPLPIETALRIAVQVADGLAAAHEARVIHRDLKPENVMVAPDGRARILDFGLAKPLADPEQDADATVALSGEGRILGTVAYMAPEQARGLEVDARSDHFSFGVTLYEMVTGRAAFHGETPSDTLARILRDNPEPSYGINPDVPPELERIIEKCLEKDPANRFQDTRDLVVDLRRLIRDSETGSGSGEVRSAWSSGSGTGAPPSPPATKSRRTVPVMIAAGVAAVIAAVAVFGPWAGGQDDGGQAPLDNTLAVMPFQNMQDPKDDDRLGQILQEFVITDLSGATDLKVFSSQRLFDVQKQLGSDDRHFDRETATLIARTVGAQTILEGTLSRLGEKWVLTGTLIDVVDGTVAGSSRVDGTDLYAMVDEMSEDLRDEPSLALRDRAPSGSVRDKTSSSLDAYRLYLAGADLLNREAYSAAADTLARAVEADPTFGRAYYKLAVAQWWATGSMEFASEEAQATLRTLLDGELYANRHERLMAEAAHELIGKNWQGALLLYEQVCELHPEDKEAWYGLGEARFHSETAPDSVTLAAFEKAVDLDPSFTLGYQHIFDCNARLGRHDASMARVERYIDANPDKEVGYRWWVEVAHNVGREEGMEAALAAAMPRMQTPEDQRRTLVKAARASMNRGDAVRARDLLARAQEADPEGVDFLWGATSAWVASDLGEYDRVDSLLTVMEVEWPEQKSMAVAPRADLLLIAGKGDEARRYLREVRSHESYDYAAGELKFAHLVLGDEEEFDRMLDAELAKAAGPKEQADVLTKAGWKTLEHTADFARAGGYLQRATELDPDDGWTASGMGWIHLNAGRLDEAEAAFRLAAEQSPAHSSPRTGLAATELARGRAGEAEVIVGELLDARVTTEALRWMSVVMMEQGRVVEAEALARRAVAMNPGVANCTQLAWVLIDGGTDLEEGIRMAEQAIARRIPFHRGEYRSLAFVPSPEHCLALAAVRKGDVKEGIALLEEAAELRPDRARIRTDLQAARALL